MDDLISRSMAIAEIEDCIEEYSEVDDKGLHNPKWCAMQEAKMILEHLPTVDAVDAIDKEKVIKGLKEILDNGWMCGNANICKDAIALINALWRDLDKARPCFACKNKSKCDPNDDGFKQRFWVACGGSRKLKWEWSGNDG